MKKNMQTVFFIAAACVVIAMPVRVIASVRFTEIAWMGVAESNGQYGEWVELYNDGDSRVDLSGWKLYGSGGGKLIYTLSKSLPAGGYLLIERTTASMPDPIPNIDDEHGAFGAGGLSNAGDDLVLKDALGTVVQSLNFSSGWPAGDVATKQTMQWNGTSWITADPTPKSPTVGGVGTVLDEPEKITDENNSGTTADTGDQPAESGSDSAQHIVQSSPKQKPNTFKPHIELTVPKIVDTHVPYRFSADVYTMKEINPSGMYRWSFGDGTSVESHQNILPVHHLYRYSGTYTLWFGYYESALSQHPAQSVSTQLSVQMPNLGIAVVDEGSLRIENRSAIAVDLSAWTVSSDGYAATIAPMTMLGSKATIIIPSTVLSIPLSRQVRLLTPDGSDIHAIYDAREISTLEPMTESVSVVADPEPLISEARPLQQIERAKANSTRTWLFGAVAISIVALFILLERLSGSR